MKKKLRIYLSLAMVIFVSWSCKKLDNYTPPGASIHGKITDADGDPVQSDISSLGVKITYIEKGNFDSPDKQSMGLKADGTYTNNLMFPGIYDFYIKDANFQNIDTVSNFVIHKGDNELDFSVNPYIKVSLTGIEQVGTNVVARFTLETLNKNGLNVDNVQLFSHIDPVVSFGSKIASSPALSIKRPVGVSEEFTLQLDLSKQSNTFTKYPTGTKFWFRVGAMVMKSDASTGSTPKWNYSEPVQLLLSL